MNIFKLLMNAGVIIKFFKQIVWCVQYVASFKTMPPAHQISVTISMVEDLLNSGVIDIPGVDEKQVAEAIDKIRIELVGSNDNAN